MTTVIERLAETLPDPLPVGEPAYLEVAWQVCDLVAAGRTSELDRFFSKLESLYASPLDDKSANELYEGLMESLLFNIDSAGIRPHDLYRHLLPASRRAWVESWPHARDEPWLDSDSG